MAHFVLVHGAWCWRRVIDQLQPLGHRVHAVTRILLDSAA
jgi:hypothetical protein